MISADQIIATSLSALEALPTSERGGRATALGYQAIALQLRGDPEEAIDLLESELADPSPEAPARAQLYLSLCLLCEHIGDFARMEKTVRRFLGPEPRGASDNSGANWMTGRLTVLMN